MWGDTQGRVGGERRCELKTASARKKADAKRPVVAAKKSQVRGATEAEGLKEIKALARFAELESIQKPHLIFEFKSRAGSWGIFHARDGEGRDLFLKGGAVGKDGGEAKFEAIDADKASGMIALAAMPDCLKNHIAGLLMRALQPEGGTQ